MIDLRCIKKEESREERDVNERRTQTNIERMEERQRRQGKEEVL